MTLKLHDPELSVTVNRGKREDGRKVSLDVEFPPFGKVTLNGEQLFNAHHYVRCSIAIIATGDSNNNVTHENLMSEGFQINFEFGGDFDHGLDEQGKRVRVYPICRVYFLNGKHVTTEVAIPKGDYKNSWTISTFQADGSIVEDFTSEGVKCKWRNG